MKMSKANRLMLAAFEDKREERPSQSDFSVLAFITLNNKGCLVEENAVAVSSFAWGFSYASRRQLEELGNWQSKEVELKAFIRKSLEKYDDEGEPLPLTMEGLRQGYRDFLDKVDIREELTEEPSFALRKYQWAAIKDAPEPPLLNSFFLNDLTRSKKLVEDGEAGRALKQYLGLETIETVHDLLDDERALEEISAPALIPRGRWPGKGRYPLVLLQQAAVNLINKELSVSGLQGVNGPPGTGKTTLLRDVLASTLVERAQVMASYDNPEGAFEHFGKFKSLSAFVHLYKLSPKLKGFEIVAASSNNKAVENISKELPAKDAIADDVDLSFFKTVSDACGGEESDTWGLIASVLGNSSNRFNFQKAFWNEDDTSFKHYLSAARGNNYAQIEKEVEGSEEKIERDPIIVSQENPPKDHKEAMSRWRKLKADFSQKYRKADEVLSNLEIVREGLVQITNLHRSLSFVNQELDEVRKEAGANAGVKPSFFSWLFKTRRWKIWQKENELIAKVSVLNSEIEAVQHVLDKNRALYGDKLADKAFWARDHCDLHVDTPWLSDQVQRYRDDVFVAAINLHKAFIDAAAKPLRHNLMAFFHVLRGQSLGDTKREEIIPDLWSSLFLFTPVISTTFASVENMFKRLPVESLGWLLIDEAGQAVPQAAVGAIMRSKKVVAVGDPLQIEPVVTLQPTLVDAICRDFGVEPDDWAASKASTQSLADTASRYKTELERTEGSIHIGAPLLVHRRCADPMFSISNGIAYNNLMVHASGEKHSPLSEILGPSQWHHTQGFSEDKWCKTSGELALSLLQKVKEETTGSPDIYLISPFRIVAQEMRAMLLRSESLLGGWTDEPRKWVQERVGTVHTFQGKEAEAVIFVLGAPNPGQKGARQWAGSAPNLINVAATRAKSNFYVIGNRDLWKGCGHFQELDRRLK